MHVQYQWQLKKTQTNKRKNPKPLKTNFNQLKDITIKYEEVCDLFPTC